MPKVAERASGRMIMTIMVALVKSKGYHLCPPRHQKLVAVMMVIMVSKVMRMEMRKQRQRAGG